MEIMGVDRPKTQESIDWMWDPQPPNGTNGLTQGEDWKPSYLTKKVTDLQ